MAEAVVLTEKQVNALGEGAKRFPGVATVNGYTWRTTITRMRGEVLHGLNCEVRRHARRPALSTSTERPQRPRAEFGSVERVEELDCVFASVAGEVPVVAVDHGQTGAHVAREVEGGDAGTESEGCEGVSEIVDPP